MQKKVVPQIGRGGYLEALLHGCPDAIIAINAEGSITFANLEACKLTEREMPDLIGQNITIVYDSVEAARETNRKLYLSGGIIHDHESTACTKSGKQVPVRISASHLKDSTGSVSGAVGYFQTYRPWGGNEAKVKAYAEQLEVELKEWKDLGAPVLELYAGLSAVVVVGPLDGSRCEDVSRRLLGHIKGMKTRVVLLDLSAALIGDIGVAGKLVKTMRVARLLGARCILAGIQSDVAEAMEALLPDVGAVESYGSVSSALKAALNAVGFDICPRT